MKKEDSRNQRKASYIQTQEYNYYRHIKSYFENSIVVQLTYEHIDEFRESLLKKELMNNSINKILILLKKILDIALRKGCIKDNPCTHLRKLKTEAKKMKF
ncbi:phage integrase SAM-like domain-containing protein [Enterococcus sp. LJL99]